MDKKRPVNLNLFTIKFPIPAIISILHRASGALVFLLIPFVLWMFGTSLASEGGFIDLSDILSNPFIKLVLWLLLAALIYHLIAGIRHLWMDCGFGESLKTARFSAWSVVYISIFLIIVVGFWLWLVN